MFVPTRSAVISLLNALRILCRVIKPTLILGNLNRYFIFIDLFQWNIPIEHFAKQFDDFQVEIIR